MKKDDADIILLKKQKYDVGKYRVPPCPCHFHAKELSRHDVAIVGKEAPEEESCMPPCRKT